MLVESIIYLAFTDWTYRFDLSGCGDISLYDSSSFMLSETTTQIGYVRNYCRFPTPLRSAEIPQNVCILPSD